MAIGRSHPPRTMAAIAIRSLRLRSSRGPRATSRASRFRNPRSMSAMSSGDLQQAVPFFSVHDIERTVRFYVDGLGFLVTKEWRDNGKLRWCWLERDAVAVMLQAFWTDGTHRNVPDGPAGVGATEIGRASCRERGWVLAGRSGV